jgi:hypothetical protein
LLLQACTQPGSKRPLPAKTGMFDADPHLQHLRHFVSGHA